jgi:hypothetical protein
METSIETAKPDREQASQFLTALFGRYFQDNDGWVELRLISDSVVSKFLPKGELTEADWAEVAELNKTHHVGVGVNPRPPGRGKKKEDVRDIVCVWADVDGKDFEDGGKETALRNVKAFPIPPSIIVDSGHGYHCYWVLEKPLVGLDDEKMFSFKQILSGVVKALGADRQKVDHVCCLRLPGTTNTKDEEAPVPCQIHSLTDKTYSVDEFLRFRDETYREPKPLLKEEWKFGSKELIIRSDSAEHAEEDAEKLEIKSSVKRHILTGAPRTEAGVDHTRSGRDWLIITSLIFADYKYETIRSIFLNPKLKCSDRIREKGEGELQHDVERAHEAIKVRRHTTTPQAEAILQIRGMKLTAERRRQEINQRILDDLLTGPNPAGRGFQDMMSGTLYYFDNAEKEPWDLESRDFYYFMQERFNLPDLEYENRKNWVATYVHNHCPEVAVHRVAHWDGESGVLYLSNHANQMLRLDGREIRLLGNGEEGVFFHLDQRLTPFAFDARKAAEAANYFETAVPDMELPEGKISVPTRMGLNLDAFHRDSLLNQYLIERANFDAPDEENPVDKGQQRLLLLVYFYSLFFESLMKHKPIACFLGMAHSGKSTTATAIGKIMLGGNFKGETLPHDARSLKQVLGEHYYYEIDNLDSRVPLDMCDVLAGTSTGAGSEERTLGENRGSVFIDTHCFVAITSREPKFKRPDVVERLLVFRMGKIGEEETLSPAWMERTLLERRDAIMAEVVSNLNSIVSILNRWRDWEREKGPDYMPPGNIFRIADWEEFGRKVGTFGSRLRFRMALEALMAEKAVMTVDEDPLYQVASHIAFGGGGEQGGLRNLPAQPFYKRMKYAALDMEMTDFKDAYPSALSLARRLPHIAEAMSERLYVGIRTIGTGTNAKKLYTILRPEQEPVRLPAAYAKLLGLDPEEEHDPQEVLNRIRALNLDPGAEVTVWGLIRAFGVGRGKGREFAGQEPNAVPRDDRNLLQPPPTAQPKGEDILAAVRARVTELRTEKTEAASAPPTKEPER